MGETLEVTFDEAMFGIYQKAKLEANYNASRFLRCYMNSGV